MGSELQILAFGVILGVVQLLLAASAATSQRGAKWNLSARDGTPPPLKGIPARLDRANLNFRETFPLFAAVVLLVVVSGRTNSLSTLGAQLYLVARIAYVPLYAYGITYLRTLVWLASLIGICLVLAAFLLH